MIVCYYFFLVRYYLDGRTCTMKDFYNPDVLDKLLYELEEANYILDKLDPGTPRWLGETSSAYGGGARGLSDRYGAGFLYVYFQQYYFQWK